MFKYFVLGGCLYLYSESVEYLKEFDPTILFDSYCFITFSGMTTIVIVMIDSLILQDLERIFNEKGGLREKEPFFLSHIDYKEVYSKELFI